MLIIHFDYIYALQSLFLKINFHNSSCVPDRDLLQYINNILYHHNPQDTFVVSRHLKI